MGRGGEPRNPLVPAGHWGDSLRTNTKSGLYVIQEIPTLSRSLISNNVPNSKVAVRGRGFKNGSARAAGACPKLGSPRKGALRPDCHVKVLV